MPAAHAAIAPQRLRASWQRSRRYQVSADRVEPRFIGQLPTDTLLYECGSRVLKGLADTVAGEPISMMVTDADGLVLLRLCDEPAIVRALDRVHLAPGFSYSESVVGTNGVGLALADRQPALVRAQDHFCTQLREYTCAAVPVMAPSGELAGSINLTTWSDRSSDLLLALAQAAAGTTSAMMQMRAGGLAIPAVERGRVYRVVSPRLPIPGPDPCRSRSWRNTIDSLTAAVSNGGLVAVVGESGAGRAAAAAYALRRARAGYRILRAPFGAGGDPQEWLAAWLAELSAPATTVVATDMDDLAAWAGDRLAGELAELGQPSPLVITARSIDRLPGSLVERIDAVVEVAPLRYRRDDIAPLARHLARSHSPRGDRVVGLAGDVIAAFEAHDWPGNVAELSHVVHRAAGRTDRISLAHLPADVFTRSSVRLTLLERLERDEIVRCLTEPGMTASAAAQVLGVSRATLYRKLAHYDLHLPGRG